MNWRQRTAKRISNFFGYEKRSTRQELSLNSPRGWLSSYLSAGTPITVNRNSILTISAVYRAIHLISSTVASLPFYVYQQNGKSWLIQESHPLARKLNKQANAYMNSYNFKYIVTTHLLLDGNCYVKILPNGDLEILDYRSVSPYLYDGAKYFDTLSKDGILDNTQMLHFMGMSFGIDNLGGSHNGQTLKGISPLQAAFPTFKGGLAQNKYSNTYFEKSAAPSGVVEIDGSLTIGARDALKDEFKAAYEGEDNVGATVFLDAGMKYKHISINPKDMMLIESKKLTVEDVSRVYGVPLHLLSNLDKATYSNIENQSLEFLKYGIRPWVELMENELHKMLLDNQKVQADLDTLMRGDSAARSTYYKDMFYTGSFSPNEIRAKEGYNPYEGGDQRFVQENLTPVIPNMKSLNSEETIETDKEKPNSNKQTENNDPVKEQDE